MKGSRFDRPDDYVAALDGWRRELVELLRKAVRGESRLDEAIRWGHLVYSFEGPVLLIRAEEERVLFGFWRGRHLLEIEPRLVPSGKYEMATVQLREGDSIKATVARRLAREATVLNARLGDPTNAAKAGAKAGVRSRKPAPRGRRASRGRRE